MGTNVPRQMKLAALREAMAAGDWNRAIGIAAKFPRLGPYKAAIMRAQACRLRPGFYRGMGKCPDAIMAAGRAALRQGWAVKVVGGPTMNEAEP